jgi:DNA-binding NarL/FixJ family response regulator
MYRILLADPNPTLRSALALLLETRLNAQIVGQVSSLESLMYEAAATSPDLIVMAWELPGSPAEGRIAALRQKAPRARIIVSSARPEHAELIEGADAFLCKTDPPDIIFQTIRAFASQVSQKEIRHV